MTSNWQNDGWLESDFCIFTLKFLVKGKIGIRLLVLLLSLLFVKSFTYLTIYQVFHYNCVTETFEIENQEFVNVNFYYLAWQKLPVKIFVINWKTSCAWILEIQR